MWRQIDIQALLEHLSVRGDGAAFSPPSPHFELFCSELPPLPPPERLLGMVLQSAGGVRVAHYAGQATSLPAIDGNAVTVARLIGGVLLVECYPFFLCEETLGVLVEQYAFRRCLCSCFFDCCTGDAVLSFGFAIALCRKYKRRGFLLVQCWTSAWRHRVCFCLGVLSVFSVDFLDRCAFFFSTWQI